MKTISFKNNDNIYNIKKEFNIDGVVNQKSRYWIMELTSGLIFTETYKEVTEKSILDFTNGYECRYKDSKIKLQS